jgi:probable F420-dependent oxidoreductase
VNELGRVGLWTFALDLQPVARAQELVREIEELGYGAVWIPEAVGRDPFAHATLLLSATEHLVVGTGIAGIYSRDALAMKSAWMTVSEAFPARFVLGMGVSHAPMVEGMRGQHYGPPLTKMREYLDAMDAAMYMATEPATPPTRVLAALGPKMLALAKDRTAGAHPYFVPVEHTQRAREILGPDALLAPEQAVVLETDPVEARRIARQHTQIYLGLPNYTNNLRRLGFDDDDLAGEGSDRLTDAIVAWGDVDAIVKRVRAHHDAGADHVAVQVLMPDFTGLPLDQWRELAPALTQGGLASSSG